VLRFSREDRVTGAPEEAALFLPADYQCLCAGVAGGVLCSVFAASDAVAAVEFGATDFSHSHDFIDCPQAPLSFLCPACPSIMAGIIAAMQPESNGVAVTTPKNAIHRFGFIRRMPVRHIAHAASSHLFFPSARPNGHIGATSREERRENR